MNLGAQLFASGFMVALMTVIHAFGIVIATRTLKLEDETLKAHKLDLGALGLLIGIALCLFALHLAEITLFAWFYILVGALTDWESALFFSASAYATLGQPEVGFPPAWRLLGAIEGLVGFLLIGWSIAVFITDMNKLLRTQSGPSDRS